MLERAPLSNKVEKSKRALSNKFNLIGRALHFLASNSAASLIVLIKNRSHLIHFRIRLICSDLNVANLENFCIEIRKPNSKPFLIATWCRPPWSSIDLFLGYESFLEKLDSLGVEYYLLAGADPGF